MRAITHWLASLLVLLVAWEGVSLVYGAPETIPTPLTVTKLALGSPGVLAAHTSRTGLLALGGLAVASLASCLIIATVSAFPTAEPFAVAATVTLKASPAVAFAPLLVAVMGSGWQVKATVSAMISFFPLVVGGLDGARQTPEGLSLVAIACGARRMRLLLHIRSGYTLSGYLTGLKTAAPLSVVGAIVGEFVDASAAGEAGVGLYIARHARGLYMEHVWAGVVCATCLGLLFYSAAQGLSYAAGRRLHLGR